MTLEQRQSFFEQLYNRRLEHDVLYFDHMYEAVFYFDFIPIEHCMISHQAYVSYSEDINSSFTTMGN